MNLTETSQLLTVIARYDNRRVDDATVYAWQGVLGDLPYDDCMAGVQAHFATDTAYLMPAHVRRAVLQLREDRVRQKPHEIRAIPSRFEDDDDRKERLARGVALARAMTSLAASKAIPTVADDQNHTRALQRARRERTTPFEPPAKPAKKPKPPADYPEPQTDDVAKLATRYLLDGHTPTAVSEALAVSRAWCRRTVRQFRNRRDDTEQETTRTLTARRTP